MKIAYRFGSQVNDVAQLLIDHEQATKEEISAILEKTGPFRLHVVSKDEDSLSLSKQALTLLVEDLSSSELSALKLLISVTESPRFQYPGNSFWLKDALLSLTGVNSEGLPCYDLNSGCTGFVDALYFAFHIGAPSVIFCSETYSTHYNFQRATSCLFSDAGSACYFDPRNFRLDFFDAYSEVDSSFSLVKKFNSDLVMNGAGVFDFVVSRCLSRIRNLLELHPNLSRLYIHQASKLVIDLLKKRLPTEGIRVPTHVEKWGNQVSATLPILIKEDVTQRPFAKGEKIALVGFGVGLSYSAMVMTVTNE